jgi:Zn-dependent protease with chaperone function
VAGREEALQRSARRWALWSAGKAALAFALLLTAVLCLNWVVLVAGGMAMVPYVLPLAVVLGMAAVIALPLHWLGDTVLEKLRAGAPPQRLVNVADEIAIAVGIPRGEVIAVASLVPNVGVFPTSRGSVVVATAGAVDLLERSELEALVAAQAAVGHDRWCRTATRAEVLLQFVRLTAIPAVFLAPMLMLVVVPAAFLSSRSVGAGRDLVADLAAVSATRHPSALASALRRLRPAVLVADRLSTVLLRSLVDPCWVVPTRRRSRTSITSGATTRTFTTADESATELGVRAERMEALAAGGDPSAFGAKEYKRRYRSLGTTASLTPQERAIGDRLEVVLGALPPPRARGGALPPPDRRHRR